MGSKITRSKAIKKLIDYAAAKLKIEKSIKSLLGTSPENLELLLSQIKNLKS